MIKTKSTKRALLASALALFMCISMFVGSTFAWFTDSVKTGVNTIQAGTLDIVLEYKDANGVWQDAEGKTLSFKAADNRTNILWEPGCTYELPAIRVRNNGDLALKYNMVINGIDGDAKLLEAIEFTANNAAITNFSGNLLAKNDDSGEIVIKGHMKEEAGNEYQGLSVEGIGITVFATQFTYEKDSKDNQYDKMATVDNIDEFNAALAEDNVKIILGSHIDLTEGIVIPKGKTVTIDLAGYSIKQTKECTGSYSMISNSGNLTILDSVGTGRITLNDTGANSGSSWGAYTIRNDGTLVVENGIIENIAPNSISNVNNAIFSYAGSTTIKDGTFNVPYSRSVRQWKGSLTIEGGTFDGQVWVQPQGECTTTISGGSFKPATYGNDGSSVYVTNSTHTVNLSITNGYFATKVGAANATALTESITGGTYTAAAINTGATKELIATGYKAVQNTDGTWTVVAPEKVSTVDGLKKALNEGKNVVLTEDINLTKNLVAQKDVVIDLNGKTITAGISGLDMFQSQSNAAPSMVITSSTPGAVIDATGSTFSSGVVHSYGKTEIRNVTINAGSNTVVHVQGKGSVEIYDTVINAVSGKPFNAAGDLTLGEGTVVNVTNLGSSFISNSGAHKIVIDGAKINVGNFKVNGGAMISLTSGTTLTLKDAEIKVGLDTTYTSYFISRAENATIEDCTFDITDANSVIYDIEYKPDANVGAKYVWVQK